MPSPSFELSLRCFLMTWLFLYFFPVRNLEEKYTSLIIEIIFWRRASYVKAETVMNRKTFINEECLVT